MIMFQYFTHRQTISWNLLEESNILLQSKLLYQDCFQQPRLHSPPTDNVSAMMFVWR